jgi:4-amino-4-deoxy-L-arabinose transferase-like glycosyltransferase
LASVGRPRVAATIILIVTALLRLQALGTPNVHADEQYYLLVGARLWDGSLPYVDLWDRKPVGLFLLYSLFALFGNGILAYQLAAVGFVAATAFLLYRMALRLTDATGAMIVALAYPAWLNLMDGAGGQSPVFYSLFVTAAAALTMRACSTDGATDREPRTLAVNGAMAMLLMGLALQTKYAALGEGLFFGLTLIGLHWKRHGLRRALVAGTAWAAIALVPTAMALAWYASMGHLDSFVYANFVSIQHRGSAPSSLSMTRLETLVTILFPLPVLGLAGEALSRWRREARPHSERLFVMGWAGAAVLSVLLFGTWFKHYGLPLVPPLALSLGLIPMRRAAWLRGIAALTVVCVAVVGVATTRQEIRAGGGAPEVSKILEVMTDRRNCPFIFEGPPIIYHLGNFCIPTHTAFPSHFRTEVERDATGVNTEQELRAILATHPVYLIMRASHALQENRVSRDIVDAEVARNYEPVLMLPSKLVVYRLRPGITPLRRQRPAIVSKLR